VAPATWKDLCLGAVDPARAAAFWPGALGPAVDPNDPETPHGPAPQHPVSVCRDVLGELDALPAAAATLLRARGEDRRWDVPADPDGNEFCVFAPG
jgi:hypothetical protein